MSNPKKTVRPPELPSFQRFGSALGTGVLPERDSVFEIIKNFLLSFLRKEQKVIDEHAGFDHVKTKQLNDLQKEIRSAHTGKAQVKRTANIDFID